MMTGEGVKNSPKFDDVICEWPLKKQYEFHKMGIDLESAFDTIKRSTILRLLVDGGCSDDDARLLRLLLANTCTRMRVNNETSAEFVSTNGSFQGDSLSGALFTLTFSSRIESCKSCCS